MGVVATHDGEVARSLDTPAGLEAAAGRQPAVAANAALAANVVARHQCFAGKNAPTHLDALSCVHDRIDIEVAAHPQRTREHDGGGREMVDGQRLVGGAELREQPAGVVDAAGVDEGVQQFLVVAALLVVAQEPAKPVRTRLFGLDEMFGEVHGVLSSWHLQG